MTDSTVPAPVRLSPGDPAPEAEITADVVTHTILSLYTALNDPDGLTAQLAANTLEVYGSFTS